MRKTISAGAQVSCAREDLPPATPRSIDIGNILDEGEWSIYQKGVLLLISLVILIGIRALGRWGARHER